MFARTPRLTLRPAWPEEAAALAAAIGHREVAVKLARMPWPYTEEHARAWLGTPKPDGEVSLSIYAHEQPTPRLVGGTGLHWQGDELVLGYWLTPSAWGRGYATEAARATVDMARHALGRDRLVSAYWCDNPASGRVLAKLGFVETGREPRWCEAQGREVPAVAMALDLREPALKLAA